MMRRVALNGLMIAVALVLSIAERWVPLSAIVPIPGIKLGLANIVTLFALYHFRSRDAWSILIARCLLAALLTGSMTSLLFSLSGGVLALLSMQAAIRFGPRLLSITGVSVAGAAAHNIGQIAAASLTLRSTAIFAYLPVLLVSGAVTGMLVALLAISFFPRFARTGLVKAPVRVLLLPLLATVLPFLVTGCSPAKPSAYSYDFIGSFDTVITLTAYADSESKFMADAQAAEARFMELHRLYDIYNTYDGLNNLRTVNDNAGVAPVAVSAEILDLLRLCRDWYRNSPGRVNIAMGPVLALWHDAREGALADPASARIPTADALTAAASLTDLSGLVLDEVDGTVWLEKQGMALDVGAVAKGYACQLVADMLKERGMDSFLISGGGNVVTCGAPQDGRPTWGVGIQNPVYVDAQMESDAEGASSVSEPEPLLDVFYAKDLAVVTSGDYQRTFVADGKSWSHLIDPDTCLPSETFRSVTISCPDSGHADFLSTTVFLMPYAEGRAWVESLDGVEALWCFPDGTLMATDGMKAGLKGMGGAVNKAP